MVRGKESYDWAKIFGTLKKSAYDKIAIVEDIYPISFLWFPIPPAEPPERESRPGDFFVPMFRAMFSPLFYAVLYLWFYLMFHPLFCAVLYPPQQYGII